MSTSLIGDADKLAWQVDCRWPLSILPHRLERELDSGQIVKRMIEGIHFGLHEPCQGPASMFEVIIDQLLSSTCQE